jgi:hypothetical protein
VNGTHLADVMAVMPWVWALGALASLALGLRAGNRPGSARAAWMTAAVVQLLLAAERATGFRFAVTNALRGLFADLKRAGTHRTLQQAVIAAFLTVAAPLFLLALSRSRRLPGPVKLVWLGLAAALTGLFLATVSEHTVDRLGDYLYDAPIIAGAIVCAVGMAWECVVGRGSWIVDREDRSLAIHDSRSTIHDPRFTTHNPRSTTSRFGPPRRGS